MPMTRLWHPHDKTWKVQNFANFPMSFWGQYREKIINFTVFPATNVLLLLLLQLLLVIQILLQHYIPGVAARVACKVPGSASDAGIDPSIDGRSSAVVVTPAPDWADLRLLVLLVLPPPVVVVVRCCFIVRALAMDVWSVARLASWWKIVRLRIIVYTRFELPTKTWTQRYPNTQTDTHSHTVRTIQQRHKFVAKYTS